VIYALYLVEGFSEFLGAISLAEGEGELQVLGVAFELGIGVNLAICVGIQ
jgi:hypothetical protein